MYTMFSAGDMFLGLTKNLGKFTILGLQIQMADPGTTIKNMLTFQSLNNTGGGSTLFSIAKNINSGVNALAMSFLVLFFLMDLIELTLREAERITWERVMFSFIKMFFWKALCDNSYELMTSALEVGDSVYKIVAEDSSKSDMTSVIKIMASELDKGGLIDQMLGFVVSIIAVLFILGTGTAAIVTVLSRVFRIIVYIAFAPLPLSMCANDQTSHTGKRYVMNAFALGIEAAIMLLMCKIYTLAAGTLYDNMHGLSVLGIGFGVSFLNSAFAAALGGASQMSREILGM